jgi:hypothetical protein
MIKRAYPEEEVKHGGGLATDESVRGVAMGQDLKGEQLAELGIAAIFKQRLFKHLHIRRRRGESADGYSLDRDKRQLR